MTERDIEIRKTCLEIAESFEEAIKESVKLNEKIQDKVCNNAYEKFEKNYTPEEIQFASSLIRFEIEAKFDFFGDTKTAQENRTMSQFFNEFQKNLISTLLFLRDEKNISNDSVNH